MFVCVLCFAFVATRLSMLLGSFVLSVVCDVFVLFVLCALADLIVR